MIATYAYDALGQLVRMNDPHENVTWVYNYDRGGNILSKVKICVSGSWYPETKNYTYRGNLLTHMEVVYTYLHEDEHTDSINLFYDVPFETAKAISNGETYTNSHNLQSDIVGIVDSIGVLMVEYGCDIWAKR